MHAGTDISTPPRTASRTDRLGLHRTRSQQVTRNEALHERPLARRRTGLSRATFQSTSRDQLIAKRPHPRDVA
jgi:hypothetical protein